MSKLPKKEDRVRFDFVVWYSWNWPHEQLRLVGTFNESHSRQAGMYKRGMGLSPGIPDLMLMHPEKIIKLAGFELKAPGSKHDKYQIEKELNFGKKLMSGEDENWLYFMLSELDTLKMIATWIMENKNTEQLVEICRNNIKEVEEKLRSGAKTVTF